MLLQRQTTDWVVDTSVINGCFSTVFMVFVEFVQIIWENKNEVGNNDLKFDTTKTKSIALERGDVGYECLFSSTVRVKCVEYF